MSALHLPPFPGKKAFGRFEQEFLEQRYRMLNEWTAGLIKALHKNDMINNEDVKKFLTAAANDPAKELSGET
jgi:hypothetical protein